MVATAREEPMGMTIISSKKIWALSDVAEMNR
jgi:hypothetical protein